jgi:lipopolysaccharide transport system permease protein
MWNSRTLEARDGNDPHASWPIMGDNAIGGTLICPPEPLCEAGAAGEAEVAGAQPTAGGADLPVTVIEAKAGWHLVDVRELWACRELLLFLVWRDVKVRYKQTVLGAAWAVLQPLALMVVFTVFLGRVASGTAAGDDYPLFVFAGLLPWTFFASAISSASQSVVGNQNLVTKVYFPRLVVPFSAVGTALVDFAVAFGMLIVLMVWHGVMPSWGALFAGVVLLGLVLAAAGVGVLLAALTVAYRDFRYVVPFAVQVWMFATCSIYLPADELMSGRARALLPLNPAYGLISGFRQAMLGEVLDWYALGVSSAVSVALLVVGLLYFRRVERAFADII